MSEATGAAPDGFLTWHPLDAPPGQDADAPAGETCRDGSQPELLFAKAGATILVPQEMADDAGEMRDLFDRALRGEIEFRPPPEPERHRCLACWLVSKLLPGHDRCEHGYLESGCETCGEW